MKFKKYIFSGLIFVTTIGIQTQVKSAPPVENQVTEIAQWFTGNFDNSEQVANNPTIPFLSMSNCSVNITGNNNLGVTESIFLEQRLGGFQGTPFRVRFYGFSEGNNGVNLGVRTFSNSNSLLGLCNLPSSERNIEINQINSNSCDVFFQLINNSYIGSNAPNGCPTASGGKVVSLTTVTENTIFSLDQIFAANGNLLVGTTIEFERLNKLQPVDVPESNLTFSIIILGIFSLPLLVKKIDKATRVFK